MTRPQIGPRVQRMLTLLPWLRARPDGVPVDEVCARFGVDRRRLLADIEALGRVGAAPYLPGDVIDVFVDGDRLFAFMPLSFTRPLRLTPAQALTLVAASQALLAADPDDGGPLRRALAKLATSIGQDVPEAVRVELGVADAAVLDTLRRALGEGRKVEIDYYSAGRDEHGTRVVDPFHLASMGGQWYLSGWCHQADDERLFRLDRMASVRVLDEPAGPHPDREAVSPFHYDDTTPRVELGVAPHLRWLVETFPCDDIAETADGGVRATVPVASRLWLLRLLLQYGPDLQVTRDPIGVAADVPATAARIRARYRG